MTQELNKESILKYLESWNGVNKVISEEGEAYTVTLSNENKVVVVTTPYEVGEFFFDFIIDGEPYYSDCIEIMEDPLSEYMSYTKNVAECFLYNNVRLVPKGWWVFKTHELQFQCNGAWYNVFTSQT
jgi:hypothetical protein